MHKSLNVQKDADVSAKSSRILWCVAPYHTVITFAHSDAKHTHMDTQTLSFTCSKDPLQAVGRPGCGSACLSWGASAGRGGWRVRLWREVWRRIAPLYQHLSCTKQTHTVLAGQEDGLLHHLITHRAMQLLFHALHVGLQRRGGRERFKTK